VLVCARDRARAHARGFVRAILGGYIGSIGKLSSEGEAVAKMAAKDKIGRASEAVRSNEYVKRLIEDEELRNSLVAAYAAARSAYGRMSNGKPLTRALLEDRKLKRELAEAAGALREASISLTEGSRKRRRRKGGGVGRALLLLIVGAALALALSEDLRSKALDLLFGAEEEFNYSSTTMPNAAAPSEAGASAA
jgi:hypothetical protein